MTDATIYHLNLQGTRWDHVETVLEAVEVLAHGHRRRVDTWLVRSAEGTVWMIQGPPHAVEYQRDHQASAWISMKSTDTDNNRRLINNMTEWD